MTCSNWGNRKKTDQQILTLQGIKSGHLRQNSVSSTLPGGCGERGRSSNSVQAIIIMQETGMDLSFVEHFLLQFSEIKILLIYKRIASSLVIGKLQKV